MMRPRRARDQLYAVRANQHGDCALSQPGVRNSRALAVIPSSFWTRLGYYSPTR
jgi:hypothetical protein